MHAPSLAVVATAALAACSETAPGLLTPSQPAEWRSNTLPSNTGQERTYLIHTFAHGHRRTYRLSVNHGRKSLELVSVTSASLATCDDPTLPGCTPPEGGTDPGTSGGGTGVLTGDLDLTPGQDSVYADLSSQHISADVSGAGPFHCPSRVDDPHFVWKGHHFQIEGTAPRIASLPETSGIPKGRYLLPQGPWLSDDGRARIWSGTIDGTCMVWYSTWLGLITTEQGAMGWYGFHGQYEEIGNDANFASNEGGQYGGDVYYSLEALRTADPEAYKVVKSYLDTGACTDGWVIVIDGVRVC